MTVDFCLPILLGQSKIVDLVLVGFNVLIASTYNVMLSYFIGFLSIYSITDKE